MYALCVSGAVNTQGFVWKFFYALYINFHSFIHHSFKNTFIIIKTPLSWAQICISTGTLVPSLLGHFLHHFFSISFHSQ